jgi:poly-gamma-glutamate capsule biosynthesis protein CapA/YwtB (metallophosphatase superfamily)
MTRPGAVGILACLIGCFAHAQPTSPADAVLSIAAVGDMMLGTDYPENHLPDDDGVSFLEAVTPLLSAADITVGNLEGVLMDGGEPAKQCRNASACFLFRSPTRYARYYKDAGFDAISVANNHARDFGEEGRTSSMQSLAEVGIHHSGRRDDFASFEAMGLRVAFLAFAVTRNSNLVHDYPLAAETVAGFAATHDIVIVSFHAGAEGRNVEHVPFAEEKYFGEPRGDVVRFSRSMVDAGADLLVGHGPHVVRGMELYKGRLIAYSLGNFATYYGISVEGDRGVAPILVANLDRQGNFVYGHIHSTVQIRPGGPAPDPEQRALGLIRELSYADFGNPGLRFSSDGRILPASDAAVPESD